MSVKQKAQAIYVRKIDDASRIVSDLARPKEGWLATMRKALGMSGPQLAKRAGVTKAAVYQVERKEDAGEVTIKQMEKIASAMGGKFVYAVVPDGASLSPEIREKYNEEEQGTPIEALVFANALARAEALVNRANTHMALEYQALGDSLNEAEIIRLTTEMMVNRPTDFWDKS